MIAPAADSVLGKALKALCLKIEPSLMHRLGRKAAVHLVANKYTAASRF